MIAEDGNMSSGLLYMFTEDKAIAIYDMDKPVKFKCHNCYQKNWRLSIYISPELTTSTKYKIALCPLQNILLVFLVFLSYFSFQMSKNHWTK